MVTSQRDAIAVPIHIVLEGERLLVWKIWVIALKIVFDEMWQRPGNDGDDAAKVSRMYEG